MEKTSLSVLQGGEKEVITIKYDSLKGIIELSLHGESPKAYVATDLYYCLAKIRQDNPDVVFLCKGSQLNVTPSRMCSQMGGGAVAYALTMGRSATLKDLVQIFDYEDINISNSLVDQQSYYKKWLDSLRKPATTIPSS